MVGVKGGASTTTMRGLGIIATRPTIAEAQVNFLVLVYNPVVQ